MSAILSALGAWFIGIFTKDLLNWALGTIQTNLKTGADEAAAASQAQADAQQLANAKTSGDKTSAATQINTDTFGTTPPPGSST